MAKINIDQLSMEVMSILEIYQANTIETVEAAVKEVAKKTVKLLNSISPRSPGGGDYAKSWASKRDNKGRGKNFMSMVVYSKAPEYRLTHLLEFGWAKAGGGRVDGQPHIQEAESQALIWLHGLLTKKLHGGDSE